MKLQINQIKIITKKNFEIVDLTEQIKNYIVKNKVKKGIITISTKHTTSAIIINENEPRLLQDIENHLEHLVPKTKKYLHNIHDDNAASHLKSIILSPNQIIPIQNSKLDLGTWQSILFVELDGPRERTVTLSLVGE